MSYRTGPGVPRSVGELWQFVRREFMSLERLYTRVEKEAAEAQGSADTAQATAETAATTADWSGVNDDNGTRPENNATVGATAVEQAAINYARRNFLDDFSDGLDYLNRWQLYSQGPGASLTYYAGGSSILGGGAMRLNDDNVLYTLDRLPFDPDKLYRIEFRVYVYNHQDLTRTLYLGLMGWDADGNRCNASGADSIGGQHYIAASGEVASDVLGWRTYVAYVKGNAAGNAEYSSALGGNHVGSPAKLHANVRFMSPLIYANYNDKLGDTLVDYIKVDPIEVQDQRNLPHVQSAVAGLPTSVPTSAVDAGSTATINIAAHNYQFDFGVVSYNAGSISGLDFSTKYYIYCDDPEYKGGAVTYVATTSIADLAASTHRHYVDTITTPSNGGGSTGGSVGDPNDWCVDYDTMLPDGRLLRTLQPGERVECIDVATGKRGWFPLRAMGEGEAECFALVTPEGAEIWQSESTPMDLPDGSVARTPDMLGQPVCILLEGAAQLSVVSELRPLGRRRVLKPDFGNRMFFAGRAAGLSVATHNAQYKP